MDQLGLWEEEKLYGITNKKSWSEHWKLTQNVGWFNDEWVEHTGCTLVTQCGKENCLHEADE